MGVGLPDVHAGPAGYSGFCRGQRTGFVQMKMSRCPNLETASSFPLVAGQVKILQDSLSDLESLKTLLSTRQKEAHRLMIPIIGQAMADGYARCVQESGK